MTCKCLTSDWLTALSITVINPIKLPERRERETRETETQRRQTETETDETETETERERERERERGLVSRHPWPGPRHSRDSRRAPWTNEWMARVPRIPWPGQLGPHENRLRTEGGGVVLCYAGVTNLLIFSSSVEQCTMNSEGNKLLKKNVNLNKWKIN
jgi:hypothetical protein